jgi:hypothetical protein
MYPLLIFSFVRLGSILPNRLSCISLTFYIDSCWCGHIMSSKWAASLRYKKKHFGIRMKQQIVMTVLIQNTFQAIPIYNPTRCKVTQFILFVNCTTCFGWYLHPSSGAHTILSTASGICHTVTATCRYRGRVGTSEQFELFHDSGR